MLRKEILKCDKIVLHFKQAKKKASWQARFFLFVKQTLKASVKLKFDTCILLMF